MWIVIPSLLIFISCIYTFYSYSIKAPKVPGPKFVWPIIGKTIEVVRDPYKFWLNQEKYGDLSKTYLGGKTMFFSAKSENTNKIFKENTGDNLRIVIGLNDTVFSDQNISCLHGPEHANLRKLLLTLFTRSRLGAYVETQQNIMRRIFSMWLTKYVDTHVEFRTLARDLNVYTSLKVLMGSYINDDQIEELSNLFFVVNNGLISLPINLPGFDLYKAVKCRKELMNKLCDIVRHAYKNMTNSVDEKSIAHHLLQNVDHNLRRHDNSEIIALPEEGPWSVDKIANVIFNLLFASQDASTSSLVWSVVLLNEHQDVLHKIRQEQKHVRPNDEAIDHDNLDRMTYTHQVVKEILRYRPPAIMVPHEVKTSFDLDGVTLPQGSIIMPSIFSAVKQGFTHPNVFNPDRFSADNREDVTYAKNYLVFGAGPHSCIGREYAINQLKVFVALSSSQLNIERKLTEDSDGIVMGPTTFPADGCIIKISKSNVY